MKPRVSGICTGCGASITIATHAVGPANVRVATTIRCWCLNCNHHIDLDPIPATEEATP